MALGKTRNRINVKGGGNLQVRELSPSATESLSSLGYQGGTTFTDEHQMQTIVEEAGLTIEYLSGGSQATIKGTLKQSGIDEVNFLKNASGKVYELYYKCVLANGSSQELNIPLFKFKPGPVLEFAANKERGIPFEGIALAVKADMTRNPTGFNITADSYYVIAENAVAIGAPADTAATVFSTLY
jgi:hypothetical protein